MNKENREKVSGIIASLRNLDDQIRKLHLQEETQFNKAFLTKYLAPEERDLKTRIRGKNISDMSHANCQIAEVISTLEGILFREVTE